MLNKNIIPIKSVIAVALSGGKDSMALIDLLLKQARALQITVKALNVEHGIRGESSVLDSQFVKDYCKKNNIPLLQKKVDAIKFSKENGLSVEEGARKLRYEFFESAVSSGFCDFVATAHHLSDNVETVLFNLFRGASPSGLTGIKEQGRNGVIIRPLLDCKKEMIDEYVSKNNLPYVTDETNFSSDYSRNYLRLEVIPKIKKLFPEMEEAVQRFTQILSIDNDYLSGQVENYLKVEDGVVKVDLNAPSSIFTRACVSAMKYMQIKKDYVKAHIDALIDLKMSNTGKKINLLNGVVAIKENGHLVFYKEQNFKAVEVPFSIGEFLIGEYTLIVRRVDKIVNFKQRERLYIDAEKIPNGAVFRFRKNGDVFEKFGGGSKNLGDFMTDKKIPLRKRDFIPVLASNSQIFAICGVEISNKAKIDEKSKKIYSIELKRL